MVYFYIYEYIYLQIQLQITITVQNAAKTQVVFPNKQSIYWKKASAVLCCEVFGFAQNSCSPGTSSS